MKYTLSDKIIAYLALFSGLTISAVAVWYSVAGLVSIFAAAVTPIIVMGVALEISKLIATLWLKLNWQRAPLFIKTYMTAAVLILMVITSMGIFGFLSKAHSDQSLVSGDVQSKIAVYDEKIKVAKDNIDANRKALKQMDEAVDQVMGRSQDEKGADKAVALRRGQTKERTRLLSEIAAEQKIIAQLSEERAPIAAEVRKVEAEVGPIKYIAAFIYGDNPDSNILEKAVTWVIIIIVSVFDPLAVILLLASQYSFQWFRKSDEDTTEGDSPTSSESVDAPTVTPVTQPADDLDLPVLENEEMWSQRVIDEANSKLAEIESEPDIELTLASIEVPVEQPVEQPAVIEVSGPTFKLLPELQEELDKKDDDEDHEESAEIKQAKQDWKKDHPNDSLKHHRLLFEKGLISKLPWEDYLKPVPDFTDAEAAKEAAKWAAENPQTEEAKKAEEWASEQIRDLERPGDYVTPPTYMENVDGHQVKKTVEGYTQNAEQNESTLWNRVKKAKE